jgi:CubicO group peptidase (beta-lactamase class C family)
MPKNMPRSTPEAQGVNPAAVTKFIDGIEAAKLELHSFMMVRHGSVVAEGWWKPYAPEKKHMLFSLSKSFTSTAVGFAVTEGLLSVDDLVLSFFKDDAPAKPSRYWQQLKVRHLLSMTTGHGVDTTGFMVNRRDGDWVKGFFSRSLKYKPGNHFLYNTGATYMLAVIVQKLTGQRVLDYLTPRLLEPLGIEDAVWEQCPKGYNTGGFGLNIKTEDIARFGQFLLQRGMWDGVQLLPTAWVDEATSKQSDNEPYGSTPDWKVGYGYQFWRCVPDCYRGDGAFGQYCIVIPRLDTVLAITSGLRDMQAVLTHIWDDLLPAITGDKLPSDLPARSAMQARLAGLAYNPVTLQASSPMETALSGKTFKLEANQEKMTKISFSFTADQCDADISLGKKKTKLSCGRGRWLEGTHAPIANPGITPLADLNSAASFTWEGDNTLVITSRAVNTPFVSTIRVVFGNDTIELTNSMNVQFTPATPAVIGKVV